MTSPPSAFSNPAPDGDTPSRADLALIEQAARHRWPMRAEFRQSLINRLWTLALDPDSKERTIVRVSRVLALFDRVNLQAEIAGAGPDVAAAPGGSGASPQEVLDGLRQDADMMAAALELAKRKAAADADRIAARRQSLTKPTDPNDGNGKPNGPDH